MMVDGLTSGVATTSPIQIGVPLTTLLTVTMKPTPILTLCMVTPRILTTNAAGVVRLAGTNLDLPFYHQRISDRSIHLLLVAIKHALIKLKILLNQHRKATFA